MKWKVAYLRSDNKGSVSEEEHGSSSSGDSVDIQLRSLHSDTRCGGFKDVLVLAVEARDISAGSAHIESDHWYTIFGVKSGHSVADHTTGGTRENGAQTRKVAHGHKTTVTLHELQGHVLGQVLVESTDEPVDVGLDAGCEVSVGCGGGTSRDYFDHGHDGGGKRDMREADLLCQLPYSLLMVDKGVGMKKADGDTPVALLV